MNADIAFAIWLILISDGLSISWKDSIKRFVYSGTLRIRLSITGHTASILGRSFPTFDAKPIISFSPKLPAISNCFVIGKSACTDKILSKVVTLDSYVEKNGINNIDILKIDTQGTEDQIIAGAQKTIKNNKIKLIEFELIFSEIYENPPQIYDFEKNLIPNNYKLFAMSDSGSLIAHYIYQTNMIYICPETYKKFQSKSPYKPIKISDLDMNKKEDRDKYSSFRKMSSKREN